MPLHHLEFNPTAPTALILLHGLGANGEFWQLQTPFFAQAGYRIIAPDLREFWKVTLPRPHQHRRNGAGCLRITGTPENCSCSHSRHFPRGHRRPAICPGLPRIGFKNLSSSTPLPTSARKIPACGLYALAADFRSHHRVGNTGKKRWRVCVSSP